MTYPIKKLSEICDFQNGYAFKSNLFKDNGNPILRISNIQNNNLSYKRLVYFDLKDYDADLSKYIVSKGDLVIAMSGATTGKLAINNTEDNFYLNQRVGKFIFKNDITKKYTHYLLGTKIEENLKQSVGSAIPNLSTVQIKNIEIPLPPLPTQKLIVQKLDSAFKNIDESIKIAKKNIESVKELNESVLEGIVNENINNLKTIDEICYKITDGVHNTPTYIEKGVPFLSVKDVTKGFIDFSNTRFISQEEHERLIKRCKPEYGDMLYTKVGTTGYAKSIDVKNEFSIFVSLALLKFDQNILNTKYFEYMLNSSNVYLQAQAGTRGVTNKNLVLRDIKPIKIPLPPLKKQKEIVLYLDKVFEKNKIIKEGYEKKLKDLKEMKQSILKEAFEGRLVKD